MSKFVLSGTATCAVALILTAPATAQDRMPVTARVSLAEIDLSSPMARDRLAARVRRVARMACGGVTQDLHEIADQNRCRREMIDSSRTQIAALTRSGAKQIALNTDDR